MNARIETLRSRVLETGVDAIAVSTPENIYYLTGLDDWSESSGMSSFLVIPADPGRGPVHLVVVNYVAPQAESVVSGDIVVVPADETEAIGATLREVFQRLGLQTLAYEDDLRSKYVTSIRAENPGLTLGETAGIVERLRATKDAGEIDLIRTAERTADKVFAFARSILKPGITATAALWEIEKCARELGASGLSFPTCLLFGDDTAAIVGDSGDRQLAAGDAVLMDFGLFRDYYSSDMTRTWFVGSVTDEQRRIYDLVLAANRAGVAAARPGITALDLDTAVRGVIADAGYGEEFCHCVGHGLGLRDHDFTDDLRLVGDLVLEPGMVFSIEPGIYLEGQFGIRVEDIIAITEDGCEVLGCEPRELIVLDA
ncbi:MAG: Xaa-Pro peptidase family protein [Actinomycetes bacterium]|jgi:Xaa-Pro aminopeptidase|nr:Xaa-Pro peptidase family protein [Actinomycetes bacterium]